MTDLQEHLKNLLFGGHQFDVALKGALELVREDKDWDELSTIISKTEDTLAKAKLEIQKRHPGSRSNGSTVRGPSSVKSGGSSLSSQRIAATVPLSIGLGAGDATNGMNRLSLDGQFHNIDARTTANERARMNKSPTKLNHRAKNQFFEDGVDGNRRNPDPFGIFLPNVPPTTTDDRLRSRFAQTGLVREAKVIYKGPEAPRHGIIRFEKREVAQQWVGTTVMVEGQEVKVAPLFDKSNKSRSETRVTSGHHNKNTTETLIESSVTRKLPAQNNPPGPRAANPAVVRVADPIPFRPSNQPLHSGDRCVMCERAKINCALSCGHRVVCTDCARGLAVCPEKGCGLKVTKSARDRD